MTRYFTHYWKNETVLRYQDGEGGFESWVAANGLDRKGVQIGDFIYSVSVIKGILFLLGGIQVGKIYTRQEWAHKTRLHPTDIWDSDEYYIASQSTRISFRRSIDPSVTRELLFFKTGRIEGPLKFIDIEKYYLDCQTLRAVREMPESTARIFNRFLDEFIPRTEDEVVRDFLGD